MTAINLLSKLLYVAPKAFGYAGTKDKRAATTQRVTVQVNSLPSPPHPPHVWLSR